MRDFIISLLELSAQGSIVILAVLSLRFIFDKFGLAKKYTNLLWIVPFVCLILPWKIESDFSLWNAVPKVDVEVDDISTDYQQDEVQGEESQNSDIRTEENAFGDNSHLVITLPDFQGNSQITNDADTGIPSTDNIVSEDAASEANGYTTPIEVEVYEVVFWAAMLVWFLGMCGFILYGIVSYVRISKKVRMNIPLKDNVYYVDDMDTPFVLGVLKPHIYIPSYMRSGNLECVIEHEKTHIMRHDHIKKIFAFAVLCIHWFNPIVWLAFYILEKDIEMACDEVTVERLGESRRSEYAEILLAMSASKSKFFSVPVAFGEQSVKSRIKNIVNNKVTVGVVSVLVVVLVVVLSVIFLTDANEIQGDEKNISTSDEEKPTSGKKEEETKEQADNRDEETSVNEETTVSDEEPTEETTEKELRELTMEELLEMCEGNDHDMLNHFCVQGKDGKLVYSNFEKVDTPDNEDYWYHVCRLTYEGKEYELTSTYTKKEGTTVLRRPKNSMELMSLTHVESGDYLVIIDYNYTDYSSSSCVLNDDIVKDFVSKKYDREDYLTFKLPKGLAWAGVNAGFLGNFVWGFDGDFDELSDGAYSEAKKQKDFVEEVWSSIGAIQVVEKESEGAKCKFEGDTFVEAFNDIIGVDEIVEGCDMQALSGEGGAYVYTLSESDDFKAENGVEPDDELTYWAVMMTEPDSEYVYMLYLNQRYFTKEETIALAKTIDILENN